MVFRVMDAIRTFLGLGQGTNLLYICYAQLKGRAYGFLFRVHDACINFELPCILNLRKIQDRDRWTSVNMAAGNGVTSAALFFIEICYVHGREIHSQI